MDLENLAEFLVKAKKNTYASGTKNREFSEGEFEYSDMYYGYRQFAGQEVVKYEGKTIWVMNYCGGMHTGYEELASETYDFLRKALSEVEVAIPLRGPEEFADGEFEYQNACAGTLECFSEWELIKYKGDEIYSLSYHGGLIIDK